jgi:heat shock protein HslJ
MAAAESPMELKRPRRSRARGLPAVLAVCAALAAVACGGEGQRAGPASQTESEETAPPDRRSPEPSTTLANVLAGTRWQLVEIQSMDDAIGTTRPDDPSVFTMALNTDGTVDMRLDCNRAKGTWTMEPSADRTNGRFEFGPLAGTRALCPPPNIDEQITSRAQYVRGYMIRDGRLALSLMADGGIWLWEPLAGGAAPFSTEPDPALEAAILEAIPDYTREMVEIDNRTARYVHARVDLNGDDRDEIFVYMLGSIFCGSGGCNLLLFQESGRGFSLVNNFPISRLPVIVSESTTRGWQDLMRPESGGGAPPSFVRHTFDGTRYEEAERMPVDIEPSGTRVLSGDVTYQVGVPLEPAGSGPA